MRGLNVTLPHKQAAAELVNELTPRAERAQAVNTIAFFEDTSLLGDNTDGLGLTADLERNLEIDLADKRVLILGCGRRGARRARSAAGARTCAEVIIANRTPERARKLAAEFADMGQISGCGFADLHRPALRSHHQRHLGEPAGRNAGDAAWASSAKTTICYDMAYGRGHTPFTLWAKSLHAARTTKGWGMLVEQAAESFLLWRGIRPDTEPVLEALAQHT